MSLAGFPRALGSALRGGVRLVTLQRASRLDFASTPELLTAIVAIDLTLSFVFGLVAFGLHGQFSVYELARALMFVPAILLIGLIAHRLDDTAELTLLPVAFAAASVVMTVITSVLYILAQHQWVPFVETYWEYFDDAALGWSCVIVVLVVWRLLEARAVAKAGVALCALALIVAPVIWLPQGSLWLPRNEEAETTASFHNLAQESAFYAQQGALERALEALEPERAGIPDLYLVAAGLYAGENVFMKDVQLVTDLFRKRFDTAGRTVSLINNVQTLEAAPIASLTSLRESLKHVGEVMNRDEDVLVLFISSHGTDNHELVVDFRPLRFRQIDPPALKKALDDSGIRWKVIVISACYSGAFIDPLKDERTLVITAASADRTSFGCSSTSESTYLTRALFGKALARTHSFQAAFAEARGTIEQWEREKGVPASEPQIYVGSQIAAKLRSVEQRLGKVSAARR
jgi:hypothetical protein